MLKDVQTYQRRASAAFRWGAVLVVAGLCLLAAPASADTAVGIVVDNSETPTAFEKVVSKVQGPLIDLIGTALLGLIAMAAVALKSYQGNNAFAKAGVVVTTYALNGAKHLVEGMSAELKVVLADGKVTTDERKQLVDKLVALMLAELPDWVQKVMTTGFGEGLMTVLKGKAATAVDAQLRNAGVVSVVQPDGSSAVLPSPP